MDKKCAKCMYRYPLDNSGGSKDTYCNYLGVVGEMRGCEAGNKCTKFKEGKCKRKRNRVSYKTKRVEII